MLLIGFFAILAGLAGVYVVKRALSTTAPVPPPVVKEQARTVPLAGIDLPAGRTIRSGDIINVSFSKDQYAKRKWPPVMLIEAKQIIGRMVMQPMHKGQPFQPDSFYPEGTGPDIAARLSGGLRAVTVSVPTDGLPSKVEPASMVDVIFRASASKESVIPEVTHVLIQDVQVLAIGENSTPGIQGGIDPKAELHPVTLAVSAPQAVQLKVAEGHGEISLALRNPEDRFDTNSMTGLTLRGMLNLPPVPQPFVAEVYRGGRRQTLTFGPKKTILEDYGGLPFQRTQRADPQNDAPADPGGASPPRSQQPPNNPGAPATPGSAPSDDPDNTPVAAASRWAAIEAARRDDRGKQRFAVPCESLFGPMRWRPVRYLRSGCLTPAGRTCSMTDKLVKASVEDASRDWRPWVLPLHAELVESLEWATVSDVNAHDLADELRPLASRQLCRLRRSSFPRIHSPH